MLDLLFIGVAAGFFLIALGYVRACERAAMSLETVVSLVVSALLLVYLAYALLRPEKF